MTYNNLKQKYQVLSLSELLQCINSKAQGCKRHWWEIGGKLVRNWWEIGEKLVGNRLEIGEKSARNWWEIGQKLEGNW